MLKKFDFHIHTRYSDGTCSHAEVVEAATTRGLEALAFTDHGPELSVGVGREKMTQMLEDIKIVAEDVETPVLAGIEANVVSRYGSLDVEDDFVKKIDILLIGIHDIGKIHLSDNAHEYLFRATRAIERQRVDVFCHPFFFNVDLLPSLSWEEIEGFVDLAAEKNVAMEVNVKYKVPDDAFIRLCLKKGVKLSIGSDAHRISEVGKIDWALSALKRVGAKREDLIYDNFVR
ncbi:MAG: PHP domain-containing protein [Candidatus Hadarchaeum sp.]|uniref:PHP domain-containing protein n=1 Tax=Candidatus Hadarchaeum sp. TaxID=2883567 RepID=UPI00316CC572